MSETGDANAVYVWTPVTWGSAIMISLEFLWVVFAGMMLLMRKINVEDVQAIFIFLGIVNLSLLAFLYKDTCIRLLILLGLLIFLMFAIGPQPL